MNADSEMYVQSAQVEIKKHSTFQTIFFPDSCAVPVRVPDYQRAYSWEQKQIDLFIRDLAKYQEGGGYYFGHFIAENTKDNEWKGWEIVDGQQRITTFVLFLMVCRVSCPVGTQELAYSMIEQFSTVSYDAKALKTIDRNLASFLKVFGSVNSTTPPSDDQIADGLELPIERFTRSQRRIVLAVLRFHQAFQKGKLELEKIGNYIKAVMTAHCSNHLTQDKSVAVNIFEMHNTRGVPLTALEIVKAMLMKHVYDHGGAERASKVGQIQTAFGAIYGMEERLAARSFRGNMTMEQLLLLHLRVIDDGTKEAANEFHSPLATNADALIEYVDSRLCFIDGDKTKPERPKEDGVEYALLLANEFKKSVHIVSETLPAWDDEDKLVGDVLILDGVLSCQFFLIICRLLEREEGKADGRIGNVALMLWEKLLFTRDFHGGYHNLKAGRDDFQTLFAACEQNEESIVEVINRYLADGFRPERTKGLQAMVAAYVTEHKPSILNGAFHWWKAKMIYVLYKYEISLNTRIRDVMKGTISVEHILPQDWQWEWIESSSATSGKLTEEEKAHWLKSVGAFINGIGNLLLITPGENSSASNNHPADKKYERYLGGSYAEHNLSREKWRRAEDWSDLVHKRGERIFTFMCSTLIDPTASSETSPADEHHATTTPLRTQDPEPCGETLH